MTMNGKIHSIETGGMVDGPGIRYVVFLQGCPMQCIYCHNPDTWDNTCKRAKSLNVETLMNDILKYKSYFKHSGGGVTLTGGEPLMQKKFATELFKQCKENGIHTTLDTSGYDNIDNITKKLIENTDLVLLDIKSASQTTFKKITKREINRTLDFLKYLTTINKTTWVRFVLIPTINDNPDEIHQLGQLIAKINQEHTTALIPKIEIIPFHQMGTHKWEQMGKHYELKTTKTPTAKQIDNVKNILKQYNPNIEIS